MCNLPLFSRRCGKPHSYIPSTIARAKKYQLDFSHHGWSTKSTQKITIRDYLHAKTSNYFYQLKHWMARLHWRRNKFFRTMINWLIDADMALMSKFIKWTIEGLKFWRFKKKFWISSNWKFKVFFKLSSKWQTLNFQWTQISRGYASIDYAEPHSEQHLHVPSWSCKRSW